MFNKIITFPLVILIKIYQWVISPWLPKNCRYEPTCSHYIWWKRFGYTDFLRASGSEREGFHVAIRGEDKAMTQFLQKTE